MTRDEDLLWEDAKRAFAALIGEIEAAGESQKKTAWMSQAWHRRLTWVRWLKSLQRYVENQHTMALARNKRIEQLEAAPPAEGWQPIATAPKDGSWFLGWNRDCGCFIWRDGPSLITGEDPQPTHWMPLPAPPRAPQPHEEPR